MSSTRKTNKRLNETRDRWKDLGQYGQWIFACGQSSQSSEFSGNHDKSCSTRSQWLLTNSAIFNGARFMQSNISAEANSQHWVSKTRKALWSFQVFFIRKSAECVNERVIDFLKTVDMFEIIMQTFQSEVWAWVWG